MGDWTFSLRIGAASCQQSFPCELSVGLCLRSLDTPAEDRQSCPIFFSFNDVSDVIDQQLTPDNSDVRIKNLKSIVTASEIMLYKYVFIYYIE